MIRNLKIALVLLTLLYKLLFANSLAAQSILQDYFNGNKDSMLVQANMMVQLPEPSFQASKSSPVEERSLTEKTYKTENHFFKTRDDKTIFAYRFPAHSKNAIVLLHGVKSAAKDYLRTAELLQSATKAEVFVLDLRGHGNSSGKEGDVDHIGQYAEDVADVIRSIRKDRPHGKIILAGHSMGGGIALCHAMLEEKEKVDGYLLLAPLIGHNSPAFPTTQAVENDSLEPSMKIHIARIIGLKMLNELGIHEFDKFPVLFFKMPNGNAPKVYSYRANISMAPEDFAQGLKAVQGSPLLVLVGEKDEAFDAQVLKKTFEENTKGEAQILPGLSHDGVTESDLICKPIQKWFNGL